MIKLFIEDVNGYMDVYDNVYRVVIKKIDNKNYLEIDYNKLKDNEYIRLTDIRLCWLKDVYTKHEYFRYEK